MRQMLALFMFGWTAMVTAQEWPREVVTAEGTIVIYQPQIQSFSGNALSARTAISVVPDGKDEPLFGAVWLDCRVSTDRTTRRVKLEDVKVKQIRFPGGNDTATSKISAALEEEMPRLDLSFSLDLLLESLETSEKGRENARELDATPPRIIVRYRPAVLVLIDGEPILTPVEGTSLKRVSNTPFFIVEVPPSRRYFLRGGTWWFTANHIMGPWQKTESPPKGVVELAEQSNVDDESGDETEAFDPAVKSEKVPEIVVSTDPAELIAIDGTIQLSPIKGTGLLYVPNTPSRVFLQISTQDYFVLLSGRWYSAKSLNGPWVNIESKKLPADFANIPPGSECDDVLASVAGTIPAKEAILDAQIPQTAEVDRENATSDVQYDGEPEFEQIENTGMAYAVNTPTAVIRVGNRYFNCEKGVWFESLGARGPWIVCIGVPEVIYTIPPKYPVYNVRYVRVYGYNRSTVYVGYTAGYTGCYIHGGTVVYGTGYHYRSWNRHYYYSRPHTWGFGVRYDPWRGWSLGFTLGLRQPHGWISYKSRTVFAGWWGPVGYRPKFRPMTGPAYREGYHPSYRKVIATRPAVPSDVKTSRNSGARRSGTLYDGWSGGVRRPTVGEAGSHSAVPPGSVQRPPSRPEVRPTARPDVKTETRSNAGRSARVTPPPSRRDDNVYAAPDGKVLRKTPQGWQQRDRNTWKDAGQAPAKEGVDRESEARQRAAERSTSFKPMPPATSRTPPAAKEPPKRTAGSEKKKDEKKDDKRNEKQK